MFHIFMIALLFGLIFWVARGFGRAERRPPPVQELVRDALTGIYFPKSDALSISRGGETLYFSNIENRDRFLSGHRS